MVKLGLVKRECVATSYHITVRCIATIAEEFFHAFQFATLGAKEFSKVSKTSALEVEAKLFVSTLSNDYGFTESEINQGNSAIKDGGFSINSKYMSVLYVSRNVARNYATLLNSTPSGSTVLNQATRDFSKLFKSFEPWVRDAYNEQGFKIIPSNKIESRTFERLFIR